MDEATADTLATYERIADEYRERHTDRSVVAGAVETVLTALDGSEHVLDVGCGPGWESATFSERGFDVTAIDLTSAFLAIVGDIAPDVARARMDMRELGVAANAFDGVWAYASFLHVPLTDATETLGEFRRVLRPGGACFCAVARGEEVGTDGTNAHGERDERRFTLYTAEALRERAVDAGFTVETLHEGDDGEWLHLLARAE